MSGSSFTIVGSTFTSRLRAGTNKARTSDVVYRSQTAFLPVTSSILFAATFFAPAEKKAGHSFSIQRCLENRVRPGFEYPHPDASKLKYSFSFLCYSVLIPIQPRIIRSTIRIDHHCDGTPKAAQISPRGSSSFSAATVFNASSSTALY